MKNIIIILIALFLSSCNNPVAESCDHECETATTTVVLEESQRVPIKVLTRSIEYIEVYDSTSVLDNVYFVASANLLDTAVIEVPEQDSLLLLTVNSRGYKRNYIDVVEDSLYILDSK